MKSILILSHAMELGGAEKSLLGLLNAIDSKKYQVDLFLMRHEGSLLEDIPENINLLPEIPAYTVLARPLKDVIKERHFILAFGRIVGKIKARSYEKKRNIIDSGVGLEYSHKYTVPYLPKIQKQKVYDMAISFLTPHYFVEQKVRAKKKIAWIHTDYSKVQINVESELKMWKKYDKIVSISDAVTESFLKVFPDLKDKIVVIENILPEQLIYKQMDEFDVSEEMFSEGVKLLSIGRYCYAKNFDNIPNICSRMLNKGINITWYIIGFGVAEELIKEKIREEKMENHVILLGKKQNPYPYIKACDIYVQPSRYEGKSVAVREAQLIKKPVIITNYSTAKSQLENEIDGLIVPMENKDCADQMVEIIQDVEKLRKISEACSKRDYSNKREVQKLYKLFE